MSINHAEQFYILRTLETISVFIFVVLFSEYTRATQFLTFWVKHRFSAILLFLLEVSFEPSWSISPLSNIRNCPQSKRLFERWCFIIGIKSLFTDPCTHVGKLGIVTEGYIRRIWHMREQFVTQTIKFCHCHFARVRLCIVLVEEHFLKRMGSGFLQIFVESVQQFASNITINNYSSLLKVIDVVMPRAFQIPPPLFSWLK